MATQTTPNPGISAIEARIEAARTNLREQSAVPVRRTTVYGPIAASARASRGRPLQIRRALAFAALLESAEQPIFHAELLVGSHLGVWPEKRDVPTREAALEEAWRVVLGYAKAKREQGHRDRSRRNALMARNHYNASIPYDMLQSLIAELGAVAARTAEHDLESPLVLVSEQEIGRELERHFNVDYGEDARIARDELHWIAANHLDLNYTDLVKRGLGDIGREIEERRAATHDPQRLEFYEAVAIAHEATVAYIRRYASHAREEAQACEAAADRWRAGELHEIASILDKVATERPDTFREALQLVWMTHIIANTQGGSAMSFARFDQYMRPFYESDLAAGTLTREDAKTLLATMFLKVNEPKMRTVQSLTVGGTTLDGRDGTSDLSRLILEVTRLLKLPYPNVSVRVSSQSPSWIYDEIVETMRTGAGHPMLLNDETWIRNLAGSGFSLEEARDYYNMGCVEIMIQGRQPQWISLVKGVDFPGAIELVLSNGSGNLAGESGPRTGLLRELSTFDDFLEAYLAQLRHRVEILAEQSNERDDLWKNSFDPFSSMLIRGCLENGADSYHGGTSSRPSRAVGGFGLGTAADSLAAVRRFVYDKQSITLEELATMLRDDYRGAEDVRLMLERGTPAFGNDDDYVDEIAARVFEQFTDSVHGLNEPRLPHRFVTHFFSYTRHVNMGEIISATPNGRRARTAMSDALGATQGRDASGPTRLVKSVLKLDPKRITGGCAVNLKVTASLLKDRQGIEGLKALVQSYVAAGGLQLQVNVADAEELCAAQREPAKYADLVVRVAGFCEYFTQLDRKLQDEIIARTSHAV
jgi:formate C-acetyltransferase